MHIKVILSKSGVLAWRGVAWRDGPKKLPDKRQKTKYQVMKKRSPTVPFEK